LTGLFDVHYRVKEIRSKQTPLVKLNSVIDWEMFRPLLDASFAKEAKGLGGRPSFDKILMFKILVLQRYYNLSDEQTEFQIKDRFSFMDFLGLSFGDKVPDEKTIWVFKDNISKNGLSQKLFDLFTNTLSSCGIIAKEGSIIDASFVDVPRQRNTRDENADIKKGAIPLEFAKLDKNNKQSVLAQKDCDARWTSKNHERHFGYKNHVNADKSTKIITRYSVTSASPHDSTEVTNIVDGSDKALYADSAYRSKKIEIYLASVGCQSLVHEKGYRNKELTDTQKESNRAKSKIRARVEHIFGFMTNSMNKGLELKAIGKQRITSLVGLLNLSYNLFRYEQLVRLHGVKVI